MQKRYVRFEIVFVQVFFIKGGYFFWAPAARDREHSHHINRLFYADNKGEHINVKD